ncbi:MAG: exodeoxyribonuclease VII large subunit [Bellilinea sp.]|jgi:exodeoxyribonuclease VII large subunit
MDLPLSFPAAAITVSDLTRYLRQVLESDEVLRDVWVAGEISNLSRPASGHIYFTLKDVTAALRCVIWRMNAQRVRFNLSNGQAVEAHGHISLYERDGQYQLYVDALRPAGEGWLYREFLRLKARLESEGLFDEARKRPLPAYPQRIGIVTSPTGAALQDMLNTLRRRYPLVEVILAPAAVQGDEAPPAIIAALKRLFRVEGLDVILLARGGGSLEDLWAFNDERVVRTVASSPLPVVTGIGHETDFTLCDFAADLRAPTPSAAAELVTPDAADLRYQLMERIARLQGWISSRLSGERRHLAERVNRISLLSPQRRIQDDRQRLDQLNERAARSLAVALRLRHARLDGSQLRLAALNPLAVLRRGYAVVLGASGVIHSARAVQPGDELSVRLADGRIQAQAQRIIPEKNSGENYDPKDTGG